MYLRVSLICGFRFKDPGRLSQTEASRRQSMYHEVFTFRFCGRPIRYDAHQMVEALAPCRAKTLDAGVVFQHSVVSSRVRQRQLRYKDSNQSPPSFS